MIMKTPKKCVMHDKTYINHPLLNYPLCGGNDYDTWL